MRRAILDSFLLLGLVLLGKSATASVVTLSSSKGTFRGVVIKKNLVLTVLSMLDNPVAGGGTSFVDSPNIKSTNVYIPHEADHNNPSLQHNIAVIQIDTGLLNPTEIYAFTDELIAGTSVHWMNDAEADANAETVLGFSKQKKDRYPLPNLIETTANHAIAEEDLGSPLFDKNGKLIGLLVSTTPPSGKLLFILANGESAREARTLAIGNLPATKGGIQASESFFSGSLVCSLTFVAAGVAVTSASCLSNPERPYVKLTRFDLSTRRVFSPALEEPITEDNNFAFLSFEIRNHPVSPLGMEHKVDAPLDNWQVQSLTPKGLLKFHPATPLFPLYSGSGGDVRTINLKKTHTEQNGQLFNDTGAVIGTYFRCDSTQCRYTSLFSNLAKTWFQKVTEETK